MSDMKYIIYFLFFILIGVSVKGQTRPSGIPTQFSTGWFRQGWPQADSGTIFARRDTTFLPRFTGTVVMRPQDRKFYYYDSTDLTWYLLSGTPSDSSFFYVDYIPQAVAPTYNEGRLWYDDGNNTLSFYDNISGTSLQIGQENVVFSRNNTGSQINDGQAVYISGSIGQNSTISLARANALNTTRTIGLATHNIANNSTGKVTTFGLVNDINTSAFSAGDRLYLSAATAGALTNVEPDTPNYVIFVGYCLLSHVNQGKILVDPQKTAVRIYQLNDTSFVAGEDTIRISSGGGGTGTATSVGLSMPSAFTVSGSPITTSGTFNVSGAGTSLQYIRGDGTLATFDTTAIPNFYIKARSLLSGTSPITYNSTTGAIGINNATASGTKGAATFVNSSFSDNGLGTIDLLSVTSAGTCINCDITFDAKGRAISYASGTPPNFVNAPGAGDTLSFLDTLKRLNAGFGITHTVTNYNITQKVDTSVIATQYDLTGLNLQQVINNGSTLTENEVITIADSLKFTSGFVIIDSLRLPALTAQTDTTVYKPLSIDASGNVSKMSIWPVPAQGLSYIYSTTAPTNDDTLKLWIKTPSFAYVHDVYFYIAGAWKRFGWLTENGVFSRNRPVNTVITGQSNAAGVYPGGDTARVPGIIGFTTGAVNNGIDAPTHWAPVYIGISPFFQSDNNMAHAFAKKIIREGVADIVRIIAVYEGGQNIKRWIDSTGGVNTHYLLDSLRNRLTRSGIDTIDAVLWHQGESGGVAASAVGGYFTDLQVLLDTLYSPLTPAIFKGHTRFIGGGLGSDTLLTSIFNGATASGALQRLMNDRNEYTSFAPAWGVPTADATHFSGPGLDSMGHRYFAAYKSMPRNTWDEEPKFSYNVADDTLAYLSRTTAYLNGITGQNINGYTWGLMSGLNRFFTVDGTTGITQVGNAAASGFTIFSPSLCVQGRAFLNEGSANSILAGNYNLTGSGGTHLRNTVHGNYVANWNNTNAGSDNVLMGYSAGYTTTATASLNNNVAIGASAMRDWVGNGGVPGTFNTAVGVDALRSVNGGGNAAVGSRVGRAVVGRFNSLLGYDALSSSFASLVHTGSFNSAVGYAIQFNSTTQRDSSSALGAFAIIDSSSQVVLGHTGLRQLKIGDKRWKINMTPSNGDYYAYNSTNSQFELIAAPSSATTLYSGDGTLAGNRSVNANNLNLTFSDVQTFRINHDVFAQSKADGTFAYSNAIVAPSQQLWLGYTPTVGTFSKGAAVIIDTNNNVALGTSPPPVAAPLYADGAAYIHGLQSGRGNFYRVSDFSADHTMTNTEYWANIDASGGNITITLPAASTVFGSSMGIQYVFKRTDASANTVTVQRNATPGTDLIDGAASFTIVGQYTVKEVQCVSTSAFAIR